MSGSSKLRFDIEANSDAAKRALADLRREFDTTLAALKKQQGDIAIFKAAQRDAAALEKQIKSLAKAGGDTSALTASLTAQRAALAQQSAALTRAGVDTNKLASEQARLRVQAEQATRTFRAQASSVTDALDGVQRKASVFSGLGVKIAAAFGLSRLNSAVRDSVEQFANAEKAYRGLEAVANYTGVGIGRAWEEAGKLAADGLLTTQEAAKALQNLLSRGYNIDQSVQTITRLKDAASFNRQAALAMGEAVIGATEGLKNENSMLVDNAGVTKNVSVMWKEYAASVGKSVDDLTLQEKIQAEVNGILRETEAQAGNAAKAMDGYQGQIAKANAEQAKFEAQAGKILAPVMVGLRQIGLFLIDNVAKPIILFYQRVGVAAAATVVNLGIVKDAISNFDFSGLWGKLADNTKSAKDRMKELGDEMKSGDLDFQPLGTAAKKAGEDTSAAAAEMGKAMKQAAQDRKEAVSEQIKDAERLRDALIKAFDDSLKAEQNYRDQAKKLRAEAAQQPKDSSAQGQASASLDLIAAQLKLNRIKTTAPLKDVQDQAAQVRQLAALLDDQARAQDAVNQSKLAEADALDRAAAGEKTQQAGITEQQKLNEERITKLQLLLKDLEAGKTVKIDADTAKASTALEQVKVLWDGIQDKVVTLTVNQNGTPAALPAKASGGLLQGPGTGTSDDILARVSNGEYVLRAAAVKKIGLARLNHMNLYGSLPRFAEGGLVEAARRVVDKQRVDIAAAVDAARARYNPPKFAGGGLIDSAVGSLPRPADSGGAGGNGQVLNLTLPGVGTFETRASSAVAAELERAVRMEALKHGRRA